MSPTCKDCGGACCKGFNVALAGLPADNRRWMSARGKVFGNNAYIPAVCEWFKDKKCTVYETRPLICQGFEVGSEECLMAQKAY